MEYLTEKKHAIEILQEDCTILPHVGVDLKISKVSSSLSMVRCVHFSAAELRKEKR